MKPQVRLDLGVAGSAVWVLLALAPSPTAAQETPAPVASAPVAPPAGEQVTRDEAGAEAEARALYAAAQAAFHEGRFENSLQYFQRAYELTRRPALLYNLGVTYDRMRRDDEALAAFEQYLREEPDAENVREVEGRVAVLRQALARTTDTQTTPAETTPVAATPVERTPPVEREIARPDPTLIVAAPSNDPGPAPWIVVGIGGAAVVTGAVLLAVAAADVAAVEGASPGTHWSEVRGAYERSEAESIAGGVLLGVGAAAAVAGVVWAVAGSGGSEVEVAPTAGGVVVRGTF
ncbi:MAG: tetratricopeptide repeat protein [Deltaproteobacteria bacterium]|nr:tetratricopeptide repeat protein [Deltaproteobacteria bacterium]